MPIIPPRISIAVRNYFISVYIALRSGAGLLDDERKIVHKFKRGNLFGCLLDCFAYFAVL